MIKEYYFCQLSVWLCPNVPGFKETGWIIHEDVNVEHLIDIFTSIDVNSAKAWDACAHFMDHIGWHRP